MSAPTLQAVPIFLEAAKSFLAVYKYGCSNSGAVPPEDTSCIYAELVGDAVAQIAEVSLLPLNYTVIFSCVQLFNFS